MPTLWPFCPTSQFSERLQWVSNVISTYGAEQRVRLTDAPRQTLAIAHSLTMRQYEKAKLLVQSVAGGAWYLPMWHERQRVTVSGGATFIPLDTTTSDYRDGGYLCLWASDESCEIVQIASSAGSPSGIVLSTPTTQAYTSGFVMPVRTAYCPNGIEASRSASPRIPLSGEWIVYDGTDLGASSYPTYRGYPVVADCPAVGSGGWSDKLQRLVDQVDSGIGTPFIDDVRDRILRTVGMQWMPETLADLWDLRTFLHSIYGMQKAFWLPDWTRGMELAAQINPADTTITVTSLGLNGVAETGDLWLRTTAGAVHRFQYTSVSVSGANEVLALSAAAGVTIPIASVRTLCQMRLVRLAQDSVEIEHIYRGLDRNIARCGIVCEEVPFA